VQTGRDTNPLQGFFFFESFGDKFDHRHGTAGPLNLVSPGFRQGQVFNVIVFLIYHSDSYVDLTLEMFGDY
jgi:hypothetical protein